MECEKDLMKILIDDAPTSCTFYILRLKYDGIVPNRIKDPIYVGSTTLSLKERLRSHISEVKHSCKTSVKNKCMLEYGVYNWEIVLVKEVACTKRERFLFEERVINMLFPSLNERVACTGINIDNIGYFREYRKLNPNYHKNYYKNYYQQNKDKIFKYKKEYSIRKNNEKLQFQ